MLVNPLLLLLALTVQTPPSTGQSTLSPEVTLVAQREADVHNFLVMRLRFLKKGAAVEEMKSEIVNEIDFSNPGYGYHYYYYRKYSRYGYTYGGGPTAEGPAAGA